MGEPSKGLLLTYVLRLADDNLILGQRLGDEEEVRGAGPGDAGDHVETEPQAPGMFLGKIGDVTQAINEPVDQDHQADQ